MTLFSRRQALKSASCGFGYLALAGLAAEEARAADPVGPLAPKQPHFSGTAKRVIFLCMRGGPSHVDTFDHKPMLKKHEGKSPGTVKGGPNQNGRKLKPSPWEFKQHGESGLPISDLYPNLAKQADELCLINGAHTTLPNHPQALVQLHTGQFQFVRPSVGSWVLYGLGAENQDLPGFVTLKPPTRLGGAQNYGSAFLPAVYQGTAIGRNGQAITDATIGNISNPRFDVKTQRKQLDLLQNANKELLDRQEYHPELEGVIDSYELAFRMQTAVPKLMDVSDETQQTMNLYGIGSKQTEDFGRMCLMARRFAEAGVRYIELTHEGWDQHNNLNSALTRNCGATDQPIAGLIADLKQRDLLKDTLIIWSGEFGRTPAVRREDGRDHNATGFSVWMAGGGVKGGLRYGATDDFGITAVENAFHTHDLHATTLHMLGLDHTKLTYRYAGRDFRLTDVHGNVAHDILG